MSETKTKHIVCLIESTPLSHLKEEDLATIRAHTGVCLDCQRAFEAAQISEFLLKERAAEKFEPPPFFHTRVLAALRERQSANEQWSWSRLWQATGALASSMVATIAALAVLTFTIPGTQTNSGSLSLPGNGYSAEEVILNQSDVPDSQTKVDQQISDGQVLTTLYGPEDDTVR